MPSKAKEVVFDSGDLSVTRVEGDQVQAFFQKGKKTTLELAPSDTDLYEVKLFYQGSPKSGLVFFDDTQQLYTVYFTSEWMVCHFDPDDKATFSLDLLIPKGLMSIGSGRLKDTLEIEHKVQYAWRQDYETPAYTYGFTIGHFKEAKATYGAVNLKYYSEDYGPEELGQIFQYTGDMLAFFEEKSGITFPQDTYSQILIGNHYQEMSGFAVLRKSYGALILEDSTETDLISHELAHQWWGNRITCTNWNHFWLNEGFATFMSAAYNEHRFGKAKYQENINAYFQVYDQIRSKGKDKPLVFKTGLIHPEIGSEFGLFSRGHGTIFQSIIRSLFQPMGVLNDINYPLLLDGGLSNLLEARGCDLNHQLWTARLLDQNPEAIVQAHLAYIKSGARCIITSSYQASIPGLMQVGFSRDRSEALILQSIRLAELAIQQALETGIIKARPLIAASVGPYGAYLADGSEYRGNYGVSDEVLRSFHLERIQILERSNADILACETIPSLQEATVLADILVNVKKPAWVSFSCKDEQHIHDGSKLRHAHASLRHIRMSLL